MFLTRETLWVASKTPSRSMNECRKRVRKRKMLLSKQRVESTTLHTCSAIVEEGVRAQKRRTQERKSVGNPREQDVVSLFKDVFEVGSAGPYIGLGLTLEQYQIIYCFMSGLWNIDV